MADSKEIVTETTPKKKLSKKAKIAIIISAACTVSICLTTIGVIASMPAIESQIIYNKLKFSNRKQYSFKKAFYIHSNVLKGMRTKKERSDRDELKDHYKKYGNLVDLYAVVINKNSSEYLIIRHSTSTKDRGVASIGDIANPYSDYSSALNSFNNIYTNWKETANKWNEDMYNNYKVFTCGKLIA